MRLVDEVLGGERMLVLVASRDPELDEPGPDELYDVGVVGVVARMLKVPDGTMRILVQATERVRIERLRHREAVPRRRASRRCPTMSTPRRELEALTRNVQRTFSEIIEEIPYLPEELQLAVTNIDDALGAVAPDRRGAPDPDGRETGAARGGRRHPPPASPLRGPRPRARADPDRLPDPVRGPVGDRQGPARVLPARAAQGDPARARRGGRDPGRDQRAARADRGRRAARGRAQGGRPRALPPRAPARRGGRVRRHPHLPRVAGRAPWSARTTDDLDIAPRARGARRRPLRPREGQGPDPRIPRRADPQPRLARADPLLRRPARGRQDEPWPLDRPALWAASSSASRSAAFATRRRSAATAAPTSARCPGRSSARCATPARATPCS